MACQNNLKQYGIALQNYHDTHKTLPTGMTIGTAWTWRALLLPFMEEGTKHELIDFQEPNSSLRFCYSYLANRVNSGLPSPAAQVVEAAVCSSDPWARIPWNADDPDIVNNTSSSYGKIHIPSNYFGVSGTEPHDGGSCGAPCTGVSSRRVHEQFNGSLYPNSETAMRKITDGTSKTIVIGERGTPKGRYFGWNLCAGGLTGDDGNMDATLATNVGLSAGTDNDSHTDHFWSYHPGAANFTLVDGSVHSISYDVDYIVFQAMSTRADSGVGPDRMIPEPQYTFD
jgi:prepilin-type processing-associated H-X9-DG protein